MTDTLPMLGLTHGNRSAVTCALKCDSACAHPVPNPSEETTFADLASRQLKRRAVLIGAGTLGAAAALDSLTVRPAAAAPAVPATTPPGGAYRRAGTSCSATTGTIPSTAAGPRRWGWAWCPPTTWWAGR